MYVYIGEDDGNFSTIMKLRSLLRQESTRRQALVTGQVVPDPARCVQCGICSFYCPIHIDVRRYAWLGEAVKDSHCLTCGECVARCPRGVLQFERTNLFGVNE
jgi:ferredoxin